MIMINSSTLESDSAKHLCISINPLTEKFDDINNNHYQKDKTSFDSNNIIKQDSLSSSSNDTTLLTTTTTMTTVEVKVKTTKTSSRKRKLNIINDNNNDNINKQQQQAITKNKKKQRITKIDNDDNNNNTKKKKTNNSKTIDQSSVTDESSFGSCEPGTSVVLHGIVWNETDKGILVVNITWRGKTYVGALLNTTEQNWAPPRYKSDIRTTKQNYNRDHPLSSIPSSHESTERILRNGKRRGSSTTVTPSSTTKTRSFKIPETPSSSSSKNEKLPTSSSSSTNINDDDEANIRNTCVGGGDDEIGDNYSSRSVSPTTSGISTTSSSPPLSNNNENQSILNPIDLSNSKSTINIEENTLNSKTKDPLIPYHFTNDMLFSSSPNPSDYFSSLNGSTNSFNLQSFNKTSSNVSPSSYLPIPSQLYFNSLTSPHYTSVTSLSKSSR